MDTFSPAPELSLGAKLPTVEASPAPATPSVDAAAASSKAERWFALDLLRFTAVLLMVQGHSFTVFLDRSARSAGWYGHHQFVHGYTAPMFLFAAGLAFGITTFRNFADHTKFGPKVARRLERYLWIFILGYCLHLPNLSLQRVVWPTSQEELRSILQVDALQHIAVVVASCELMVLLLRRKGWVVAVAGLIGSFCVFAAPLVWAYPAATKLPLGVAAYVNGSTGSLFPLVPWAAFVLSGVVTAYVLTHVVRPHVSRSAADVSRRRGIGIGVVALVMMGGSVWLQRTGVDPYGPHEFWRTNPWFFFFRLANVLAVLSVLCFAEAWVRHKRPQWLERGTGTRSPMAKIVQFSQTIGQESLLVYLAHVVLLYGCPVLPGLNTTLAGKLGLASTAALSALVLMLSTGAAYYWQAFKQNRPSEFAAVRLMLATSLIVVLLVSR